MKTASERLIARAQPFKLDSIGISANDIARIPLTNEMIGEVEECLSNSDVAELKWGLWFANGMLDSNPPEEFLKRLLLRVPIWLKHEEWDVRNRALELFVRLRTNYKGYRETMLKMLQDPETAVRWEVLKAYRTFLTPKDIPLLLSFQNDEYMTETEMGSPLVYAIRNDALAAIEDLCGRKFKKTEKVKPVEGTLMVYWWDWQPFLDWWGKRQSKWRFWKKK